MQNDITLFSFSFPFISKQTEQFRNESVYWSGGLVNATSIGILLPEVVFNDVQ